MKGYCMHDNGISEYIPGTILLRERMGGATGLEFLRRVYYITDGIKLSQVREISGLDGSTLQNWVKRGWILNPVNKTYGIDQLARILIINMMRDTVRLSRISFLLRYINGSLDTTDDDIASESALYDYICRVLDGMNNGEAKGNMHDVIAYATSGYIERFDGARGRLERALEIIACSYRATQIKRYTDELLDELG